MFSSGLFVALRGLFLYQGVADPLGGIHSLWPPFGIANQLLAAVALCVGTTVIVKMRRARYAFLTLLPLAWLAAVTVTAGLQTIFSDDPRLGFLAHARRFEGALAAGALPADVPSVEAARQVIFNDRRDAALAAYFLPATRAAAPRR